MLDAEVRTILRDLVTDAGLLHAEITDQPEAGTGTPSRTVPLGGASFLRVTVGTRSPRADDLEAALERAARALRTAARRWAAELPTIAVGATLNHTAKVGDRISAYLQALAAMQHADNALVVHRGRVVARARGLGELEEARWPFIVRRVMAAVDKGAGSSHAELADPDFYALTFWYGAALIVYFTGPYAVDFVRYRARRVARELADLLPELEPEPTTPVSVLPPPE